MQTSNLQMPLSMRSGGGQVTADRPNASAAKILLIVAGLVPMMLAAWFVRTHAVNCPFWDQWKSIGVPMIHAASGQLTLNDLTFQSNEHRIFFPRLVFIGLGMMTHWDTRAEMFATLTFISLNALFLFLLARQTMPSGSWLPFLLLVPANILLFSTTQFANLLWGMQMHLLMPHPCLSGALLAAMAIRSRPAKLAVCIALTTIATFSLASGLSYWVLLIPVLMLNIPASQRRSALLVWLAAAGINAALFFHGYQAHPPTAGLFSQPLRTLSYVCGFLGSPLQYGGDWHDYQANETRQALARAIFWGAVLLLLYGVAVLQVILRWRDKALRARALPWVIFGFTCVMTAGLAASARLNEGIEQSLADRYASAAIGLPVATIYLLGVLWNTTAASTGPVRPGPWFQPFTIAVVAIITAAFINAAYEATPAIRGIVRQRLDDRDAVQFCLVAPNIPQLNFCFYDPEEAISLARQLNQQHLFVPPLVTSPDIKQIARPQPTDKLVGYFGLTAIPGTQVCHISGWAVLPHADSIPADAVLLTRVDPASGRESICIVVPPVWIARQDVVRATASPNALLSGFEYDLPASSFPPSGTLMHAWAYRLKSNSAVMLNNAAVVPDWGQK